jgi:predicted HicB family RNase H-like nuclease
MDYNGYKGVAKYDSEAHIYHGDVVGIKDVITFQSETEEGLEQAFIDSVEDYINFIESEE